ncbi:MAG: methyltransferase domain-containing protein [Saprospiraceae bacterium]|nr:methyltransferase domain-containing protein [Saprospiraceae bacterium]
MQLRWQIAQFFEMRWWRRYLSGKEKEAYLEWKKAYWKALLDRAGLHIPAGASILDAGCGPAGIFTIFLSEKVVALDPLLDVYEQQLPHFRKSDYPNVRFICLPLEQFTPENPFDFVFCLNAINHVADLPLCFDRLHACTQNGGTLLVSIDTHNYRWLKRIFRLIPGDILHPHQYDLSEYQAMLTSRGFRIDQTVLLKKEWIFSYYLINATR